VLLLLRGHAGKHLPEFKVCLHEQRNCVARHQATLMRTILLFCVNTHLRSI
jgi:hypothetical protein